MEKRYINTRKWLLEKERYEDVIAFDKSDKSKERLCDEKNEADEQLDSIGLLPSNCCDKTIEFKNKILDLKDKEIKQKDALIDSLFFTLAQVEMACNEKVTAINPMRDIVKSGMTYSAYRVIREELGVECTKEKVLEQYHSDKAYYNALSRS